MGGSGSGRFWVSKKATVEECLTLDINKILKIVGDGFLVPNHYGSLYWKKASGEVTASVNYSTKTLKSEEKTTSILNLSYTIPREERKTPIDLDIPLLTTRLCSGGVRYWFACPNLRCQRRVGSLYLPGGRNYFLCRRCYDLTYKSCQESHQFDRLFARMGIDPLIGRRLFKRN
jgi:hypothetical protein